MDQSWCVETDKCWESSMGKLMETSQERKKLPLGTNINGWNEAFNLIAREKKTKQPVWMFGQRWRDLIEWQGEFNRKIERHQILKVTMH